MTKQEAEKALWATPQWKYAEAVKKQLQEALYHDYIAQIAVSKLDEYEAYMEAKDE